MIVRENTVAEIMGAPAYPALLAEYDAEARIEGLPPPAAKLATYTDLEQRGLLRVIGAWAESGDLAGFISILAGPMLHYGMSIAVSESFFVAGRHRGSMAGLKLLAAAEAKTYEIGSPGLFVSAPSASRLAQMLPKCGYRETSRVYFKGVGNA